jgi:hypothetical protein
MDGVNSMGKQQEMTSKKWLACSKPMAMLDFLRGKTTERKLRLFAVGCCRRIWHLLEDERSKIAVQVAEEFADGARTGADLLTADQAAGSVVPPGTWGSASAAQWCCGQGDGLDITEMGDMVVENIQCAAPQETSANADLLRCIFGNPFRPIALSPAHRPPTIVSLGRAAYDDRQLPSGELEPHRLAVLADALEEAGAPGELVDHLRSPGPHVRGCWPVDLVLAKE